LAWCRSGSAFVRLSNPPPLYRAVGVDSQQQHSFARDSIARGNHMNVQMEGKHMDDVSLAEKLSLGIQLAEKQSMKSLAFRGVGDFRLDEVHEPKLKD
jgi:hypothetical protein